MSSYVTKDTLGDTSWFTHDRFGMFVHWGLYSMPARGEWVKFNESMSEEQYNKYFEYFNPDLYDPNELAKLAKSAGMKYGVFTAKHHDGFCMFDSQYTDYKCTNTSADYRAKEALKTYADWMKYNSKSIYGCTMAEPEFLINCLNGVKMTQSQDGKRLFLHLYDYPFQFLELKGFAGKVEYAQFLHDGSEILFSEKEINHISTCKTESDDLLILNLPVQKPKSIIPVIELILKVN